MEETFTAERGRGAWLDGRHRLRVAGRRSLADAVVASGIKLTGTSDDTRQFKQLASLTPAVAGIRNIGSASISLAWLAAGRFDLYWEAKLGPWDVAAGQLLVREAGGFVCDYAGNGNSIWNGEVVAGNEILHKALLTALKKAG